MDLALKREMIRFIDRKVRSGQYARPEDVVQAGLATLIAIDEFGDFEKGELDALLREGEQSIKKHGTLDGDEALAQRRRRRASGRNPAA